MYNVTEEAMIFAMYVLIFINIGESYIILNSAKSAKTVFHSRVPYIHKVFSLKS